MDNDDVGENLRQRAFFQRATEVMIFSATRSAGFLNNSGYMGVYVLSSQYLMKIPSWVLKLFPDNKRYRRLSYKNNFIEIPEQAHKRNLFFSGRFARLTGTVPAATAPNRAGRPERTPPEYSPLHKPAARGNIIADLIRPEGVGSSVASYTRIT